MSATSEARCARLIVVALLVGLLAGCRAGGAGKPPTGLAAGLPRPAPVLGVDLVYADPPQVLIRAFGDPGEGAAFGRALREQVGVGAVRFSSHGFYSHLGPERTDELRRETKMPNRFLWFPVEQVIALVRDQDLKIVVGINPEDGPEAAVDLVGRFRDAGALDRIIAVELGNEPHLSHRPWLPEEYAERAAAIVLALEPLGVRFALPLTLGQEAKTPTKISDDDYTRRELAALDRLLPLRDREDIYGVIHLYGRGVDPHTIDVLNELVHPVAPRMRYLVTEFNIRHTLGDNPHLTTAYALEWMERVGWLVAHPDVAGLFSHAVPYHSLLYWSDGRIATLSSLGDPRLSPEAMAPGWHATPVGRIAGLFIQRLWRGTILDVSIEERVQVWTVQSPEGERRVGILNATGARLRRSVTIDGVTVDADVGPRSAVVYSAAGELGRVELPED